MARGKKQIPERVYQRVFERAESDAGYYACESMIPGVCENGAVHWHHRQLRSQGGQHTVDNGLAVCAACHSHFHLNPDVAYENGWIVKSHQNPAVVPCRRRGELVKFDESGGMERVPEAMNGGF